MKSEKPVSVPAPAHVVALAGSCMASVNLNTGHDKQDWEDSCNISADTTPHLNNTNCSQKGIVYKDGS